MNVIETKACAAVIVFIVSYISALVPSLALRKLSSVIKSSSVFKNVLSLVNCFSGGVFLGASLLSILPEAREAMEPVYGHLGWDEEFPAVEAFVGAGFILVMSIETFAKECCGGHLHDLMTRGEEREPAPIEAASSDKDNHITVAMTTLSKHTDASKIEINGATTCMCTATPISTESNGDVLIVNGRSINCDRREESRVADATEDDEESEEDVESVDHHQPKAKLRIIVFITALSVHMVFDGLAVGLLSSPDDVWALMVPICVHKILVLFSIGLAVEETVLSLRMFFLTLFFISLVSPLGVCFGILMDGVLEDTDSAAVSSASAFLQSGAVGTFLYVTCFEILHPEFARRSRGGPLRLLAVICGFSIMIVTKKFASD